MGTSRGEDSYEVLVQLCLTAVVNSLPIPSVSVQTSPMIVCILHDVNSLYIYGIQFRYVIPGFVFTWW